SKPVIHLPDHRISVSELSEKGHISESMLTRLKENGIRFVHEAKDLTGVDLIYGALSKLMHETLIQSDQVKYVVVVYHTPCLPPDIPLFLSMKERFNFTRME